MTDSQLLTASLLQLAFFVVIGCGIGSIIGDKARGRKVAGAWLGLLAPLGWALVLLFDDHRRKCPACRSAVDPKATKCPRCGTELTSAGRAA